ncbi:peptidoglycan-associated lipoprotein [Campylobacterota bacterium]|nr:peptidoglycan-associated lipoprotein [Campylobacterota bacterium]
MRRVIFSSAIAALLLLTGCSKPAQVAPATDEQAATTNSAQPAATNDPVTQQQPSAFNDSIPVVYFAFDSYTLKADQQDALATAGRLIVGSDVNFRIEGNCDEWGTEEYNYALGLRRAKSVQDALVRSGVVADHLSLISYGESNPVCTQSDKDCWRKNRRVEISVLP